MEKGEITIRYMQQYIKHKRGQWDQDYDAALCYVKLSEELGELARQIIHGIRHAHSQADIKDTIEEELYDVLYYTLMLANQQGVDLETWIPIKEALNNRRYPSGIEFDPRDERVYGAIKEGKECRK